jgi:hypothetical protein
MPKNCPSCGKKASGRFCANCGTSLIEPVACRGCGNQTPAGGRFCNMCGTPVAAAAGGVPEQGGSSAAGRSNVPWFVAGAAALIAAVAVIGPRVLGSDSAPAVAAAPSFSAPGGGPAAVDLSSMSPREAADRLFNRVMENVSAGDSVQARAFLPMALAAYERVGSLDLDGHYHVAILHLVNNDPVAARREADTILSQAPNHLFGLFTAAQAAEMVGDDGRAAVFFQRFLESYDDEIVLGRPEYEEHAPVLPVMRSDAMNKAG